MGPHQPMTITTASTILSSPIEATGDAKIPGIWSERVAPKSVEHAHEDLQGEAMRKKPLFSTDEGRKWGEGGKRPDVLITK